jgi:polyphosphate kinase
VGCASHPGAGRVARGGGRRGANAAPLDLNDPGLYVNRELSWLDFNQRVLDQALDDTHPLLERVKFLAIVSSNLDEFFITSRTAAILSCTWAAPT